MRRARWSRSPAASRCCTRNCRPIVKGIIARRKFVYLCTNALLMEKRMKDYQPSPYFVWSVHLDGDKQDHDKSVCQAGTYDRAVAAIKAAKARGFRCNINCTLFNNADPERMANFFDTVMAMGVDGITVSPGYAYERAPDQQHFLNRGNDQAAVPRHLPPRQRRQELVVQPVRPVPRLPRRQPELPLHAVGQPDAHRVRLAEALLPARRRLRQDLQGADGRHRLGRLRHRQLREVRRLHGPLRLRGDRREGHVQASAQGAGGYGLRGIEDRRRDGAGNLARPASARRNTFFHATSTRSSPKSRRTRRAASKPRPRRF